MLGVSRVFKLPANRGIFCARVFSKFQEIYSGCCTQKARSTGLEPTTFSVRSHSHPGTRAYIEGKRGAWGCDTVVVWKGCEPPFWQSKFIRGYLARKQDFQYSKSRLLCYIQNHTHSLRQPSGYDYVGGYEVTRVAFPQVHTTHRVSKAREPTKAVERQGSK